MRIPLSFYWTAGLCLESIPERPWTSFFSGKGESRPHWAGVWLIRRERDAPGSELGSWRSFWDHPRVIVIATPSVCWALSGFPRHRACLMDAFPSYFRIAVHQVMWSPPFYGRRSWGLGRLGCFSKLWEVVICWTEQGTGTQAQLILEPACFTAARISRCPGQEHKDMSVGHFCLCAHTLTLPPSFFSPLFLLPLVSLCPSVWQIGHIVSGTADLIRYGLSYLGAHGLEGVTGMDT